MNKITMEWSALGKPAAFLWRDDEIVASLYADRFVSYGEYYIHLTGMLKDCTAIGHLELPHKFK